MHLLKHIYLAYEEATMFHSDVIIVRNVKDDKIGYAEDFIAELNGGELSKLVFAGKTVKELIDSAGGDEAFLNILINYSGSHNDGKVTLFCDAEAYQELMIKFLKTLLPNLTAQRAFEFYAEMGKRRMTDTSNSTAKTRYTTSTKNVHEKYFSLKKKAFVSLFDKTAKFDAPKIDLGVHASTEFLLATYIQDPTSKYTPILLERAEKFYQRKLAKDLINIKIRMERDVNMYEKITGSKTLPAILGDFNVVDSSSTIEYIENKYGLVKTIETLLEYKRKHLKHFSPAFDAEQIIEQDYTYLVALLAEGKMKTGPQILEVERSLTDYGSSIFAGMISKEKVNLDLMDHIYFDEEFDFKSFSLV